MKSTFDKIFCSMAIECKELLLPLVNEMVRKHYVGDETVTILENEGVPNVGQSEKLTEITCLNFCVEEAGCSYHLECKNMDANDMMLFMFEYETKTVIDAEQKESKNQIFNFSDSGTIYLGSNQEFPDTCQFKINTPAGTLGYPVQVMKMQQYSVNDIFEKKLLLLLPFYGFVHEEYFREYEADERKRQLIFAEFREITDRLGEMEQNGEISRSDSVLIRNGISRVTNELAEEYQHVREGVDDIVIGREYGTDLICLLDEKKREGVEQGIEQGGVRMLCKLLEKGTITEKEAADSCGKTLQEFMAEYDRYQELQQQKR